MKDKIVLNKDESTLFNKLKALFVKEGDKDYNVNETGRLAETKTNQQVVNVKKQIMARMENMGMSMDGVADMSELTMYSAMTEEMDKRAKNAEDMKKKDMKDKEDKFKKNSSDTPEWAVNLLSKVEDLEGKLAVNAASEKNDLASQVSKLATNSIPEDEAKKLSVNFLKSHLAANGGHLNVNAAAGNYQVSAEKHALANMEAPE